MSFRHAFFFKVSLFSFDKEVELRYFPDVFLYEEIIEECIIYFRAEG